MITDRHAAAIDAALALPRVARRAFVAELVGQFHCELVRLPDHTLGAGVDIAESRVLVRDLGEWAAGFVGSDKILACRARARDRGQRRPATNASRFVSAAVGLAVLADPEPRLALRDLVLTVAGAYPAADRPEGERRLVGILDLVLAPHMPAVPKPHPGVQAAKDYGRFDADLPQGAVAFTDREPDHWQPIVARDYKGRTNQGAWNAETRRFHWEGGIVDYPPGSYLTHWWEAPVGVALGGEPEPEPEPLDWRTYRSLSAAGPWRIFTYTERAEVVLTLHTVPAAHTGVFPPVEVLTYTVDLLLTLEEQHRAARAEVERIEKEAADLPRATAYLLRREGKAIATALTARHAVVLRSVLDAEIAPLSEAT